MKYKVSVLFCWLIVFNFACRHPVQNEIIPVTRHLVADTVCEYPFFPTGEVILKNGHIFMIDFFSAGKMYIYNTQTEQMDFFQTMNPNYLSMADDAEYYPEAMIQHLPLSFYHSYVDRFYQYSLENNKVKLTRQNLKPKRSYITNVKQLNENKYVMLGLFHAGLLGLCDNESNEIKFFGHYPISVAIPFERPEMEQIVRSFRGSIAYSDKHSKVVYGSRSFAYLSCYRFTGKKLKFQWEKQIVPLPATQVVDGFLESDKTVTRGGFSDVTIAGDYIFASYAQKNVSDSASEVAHSILVFNMMGNLVATFYIDYPISAIMADVEAGIIYGISHEEESVIVRFQFGELIVNNQ